MTRSLLDPGPSGTSDQVGSVRRFIISTPIMVLTIKNAWCIIFLAIRIIECQLKSFMEIRYEGSETGDSAG